MVWSLVVHDYFCVVSRRTVESRHYIHLWVIKLWLYFKYEYESVGFFSSGQRKVATIKGGHINGVVVNLGSTERKTF